MTIIVGLECDDCTYIGGDAGATDPESLDSVIVADSKVFFKDNILFGFSSSFRVGQLLKYSIKLPCNKKMSEMEYLVTVVADRIKNICTKKGIIGKTDDQEDFIDSNVLCAINGKLFQIESSLAIIKSKFPYAAIGSGAPYAVGALYALQDSPIPPEEKIRIALDTACMHNAACRGPYTILKQEKQITKNTVRSIKKKI